MDCRLGIFHESGGTWSGDRQVFDEHFYLIEVFAGKSDFNDGSTDNQ
jgi:hypothetical protein